jgi:hypothetical protein
VVVVVALLMCWPGMMVGARVHERIEYIVMAEAHSSVGMAPSSSSPISL